MKQLQTPKHYLFLASLDYFFPVMRALQIEIIRRGDQVVWFFDEDIVKPLAQKDDVVLATVQEVIDYNPIAVFSCGNYMYDFFPGIKVQLFHGYPINKRNDKYDDHFKIRGGFDIYCTQGKSSTPIFQQLAQKHKFFTCYQTGWPKCDLFFNAPKITKREDEPTTILYSSTFTKGISSAPIMHTYIEQMLKEKDWKWIFMFHPRLNNTETAKHYDRLVELYPQQARWASSCFDLEAMQVSDTMLCDTSSIIIEYMFLNKPVVTYRNTQPDKHLINTQEFNEITPALEKALSYPKDLLTNIQDYVQYHEAQPDGQASKRVLDAVEHFIQNKAWEKLKPKPINIFRNFKLRRRLNYWKEFLPIKPHHRNY